MCGLPSAIAMTPAPGSCSLTSNEGGKDIGGHPVCMSPASQPCACQLVRPNQRPVRSRDRRSIFEYWHSRLGPRVPASETVRLSDSLCSRTPHADSNTAGTTRAHGSTRCDIGPMPSAAAQPTASARRGANTIAPSRSRKAQSCMVSNSCTVSTDWRPALGAASSPPATRADDVELANVDDACG